MACSRRSDSGEWAYFAASPRLKGHASPVFFLLSTKAKPMNRPYFQSEGIKIQTAGDLLTASAMGCRSFSTSTLDFARSPNCQKKKRKMSTVEVTMLR